MSTTEEPDQSTSSEKQPDDTVDEVRRDALMMIGRFGAYTAPGMVALLTGQAYAQTSRFL